MEYEEIIEAIGREAGGLPPDVAERAAQAVLQTLAERLPRGEARHILAELPAQLKPWVWTEADAEGSAGGRGIQACPGGVREAGRGG